MLTQTQRDARDGRLGSSDAPIVAGVSPYTSPLTLYHQMRGELPRYSETETERQLWGSRLEPVIAAVAAERIGVAIETMPHMIHRDHPWMLAHLDYVIPRRPGYEGPGVMEIKNRVAASWDTLPEDITLQVTHQLAVSGYAWGVVAVLVGFGRLVTFEVARDPHLESVLIALERQFLDRVAAGDPPDTRWDAETVRMLSRLHPRDSGQIVDLTEETRAAAASFLDAKAALDAAEARKLEAEGILKSAMGAASVARGLGYEITWRAAKDSSRVDLDRLRRDHPALVAEYTMPVPGTRRFLVRQKGESS